MIPGGIEDDLDSSRVGNFLHVVVLLGETGKAGTSALLHFDVAGMLSHMFKNGSDGRIFQIESGQRSSGLGWEADANEEAREYGAYAE